MYRGFISIIICFVLAFSTKAQFYTTHFGQNRIQYKNFDWKYYSTNKLEVYHYNGGKSYAKQALEILSEEYQEITNKLGYAPYNKIKLFVYNSIHDLQQSNIGIEGSVYNIGGKTDFVKLNVEIAYPGVADKFKDEIIYHLTAKLIEDMMYGGSLASVFQNSYLLSLPSWFVDGAARYLTYGWDREMDDFMREQMKQKRIKKLTQLKGEEAAIVGQSIWNFIASKYGERNIANILNLTRITRKEEKSIMNTLGVSFNAFLEDWKNFYLDQRNEVTKNHVFPIEKKKITGIKGQKNLISSTVRLNPAGNKLAYATSTNGKYSVFVKDLTTNKIQKIFSGGYKISGQKNDTRLPILDWKDEDNLGCIIYKRGSLYLNLYNTASGKKSQKPLNRFRQINSFSFNDNGKLIVISGDIDGKTDIFLTTMKRLRLRRITRDHFDDIDPMFIPGTAAVIFSSNRNSTELKPKKSATDFENLQYDLFMYDLDTTKFEYARLTHTEANEKQPFVKSENQLYYLSDVNGISNLYRYSLRNKTSSQVTNYDNSIISYDLHFNPDYLSFVMLNKRKHQVYLEKSPSLYSDKFTKSTPRKDIQRINKLVEKRLSKTSLIDSILQQNIKLDSLLKQEKQKNKLDSVPKNEENINTENFQFEDEKEEEETIDSFFSKYQNFGQQEEQAGPFDYNPKFSFNNTVTSFLWDPYRSYMMFMETEVNDILENYKVKSGAIYDFSFVQGDVFIEFQYLKHWLDFKLRYDHKTYLIGTYPSKDDVFQKYKLSKITGTVAFPFTHMFRVDVSPFFTQTSFNNLDPISITNQSPTLAKNHTDRYLGGNFSFIYDNTINKDFNRKEGTMGSFTYSSHLHLKNKEQNFGSIKLDLRHYQKIHKQIQWASRIVFGKQLGNAKKKYMLGGVDNWILSQNESQGEGDPLVFEKSKPNSDIFFNEFITNLRGLKFNESSGSNTLLFNTEIRIPIFQYLSNGPIRSNFFRNFQITSFFDIGSAWDGEIPFRKGKSIIKKFKSNNPFSAEIVKFENPWLSGMGFGVRTVLFGYYIKFDWAYPYLDNEFKENRFYFSLGLDF